jgi:hypothetical protein
MKLVYCTCNISVLEQVLALVEKCGLTEYQIIDEVKAKPRIGDPRLNSAVWPGYNAIIVVSVTSEIDLENLMNAFRKYNHSVKNDAEILTAYCLPMSDFV